MRIFKDQAEVDEKLARVFHATRDEIIEVVRQAIGGRADRVENDPINAAGQFMYIHGIRNIRVLFRGKGWAINRKNNVELVTSLERPLSVTYQCVDLACNPFHQPKAISGKGAGAEQLLDEAQLSLPGLGLVAQLDRTSDVDTGLWYLCISVGDMNDIRAELSLPTGVRNGNFAGFRERIFIIEAGQWGTLKFGRTESQGASDFEPEVRRKKRD